MKTMNKFFSILVFAFSVLNLVSCSFDVDFPGEESSGYIIIDGKTYECGGTVDLGSYVIYLSITEYGYDKFTLCIANTLEELKVNDELGIDKFYMKRYDEHTDWREIDGTIIIKDKKSTSLTIQINNLIIENYKGRQHKISGIVTLYNSLRDGNGNILPFS